MMSARAIRAALLLGTFAVLPGTAAAMTLSEAFERAQEHDPTIAASLAQLDADQELGRQERGTLLPNVSATAAYEYAKTDSTGRFFGKSKDQYPSWSAQLQARQPLFRLDWFARRDRASALDSRARTQYRDRELQVLVRIAERYFAVLVAQDQLKQAVAEAEAVRESLQDTQERYAVELVPGTDLKEAQARDDLAQTRLISARTSLRTAQDALDEVTGSGYVDLPTLPEGVKLPPLTPSDIDQWVQAALEQNPQVLMSRESVQIARADLRSAGSDAAPTLDLVGSVSHTDNSEYAFGQQNDDSRIGLELNVPIYAGGINGARRREAAARLRSAEADLRRVELETARETRQGYREVENAYFEIEAMQRALESALSAQAATQAGYDAGTRTITDVLDAKSRVVQSRRDLNNTRYNLLLKVLQLRQLAGELVPQDFGGIDQLLRAETAE
ncbi:MAG: TolC family outer membrane protein [Nevskiales bacterium]|nr:TolC family outer membrane protein [Nevskiales bacterium]